MSRLRMTKDSRKTEVTWGASLAPPFTPFSTHTLSLDLCTPILYDHR